MLFQTWPRELGDGGGGLGILLSRSRGSGGQTPGFLPFILDAVLAGAVWRYLCMHEVLRTPQTLAPKKATYVYLFFFGKLCSGKLSFIVYNQLFKN